MVTGWKNVSRPSPTWETSNDSSPTRKRIRTSAECPPIPLLPLDLPVPSFRFSAFMLPSFKDTTRRASLYAQRRGLGIGPRLGFGKDGTVISTLPSDALQGNWNGPVAIKALSRHDLYARELSVYHRLAEHGIGGPVRVCGHNVPRLLGHDDELLVIEMTIVARPFVLDFAGAYLDSPPIFPADIMEERYAHWGEVFESRWPAVQRIMAEFRRYGVYLLDPSPNNIAFEGDA